MHIILRHAVLQFALEELDIRFGGLSAGNQHFVGLRLGDLERLLVYSCVVRPTFAF